MAQQNITLEWQIIEDDIEWEYLATGSLQHVAPDVGQRNAEQWLTIGFLRSVTIAMIAILTLAGTAQPHWEREQIRVGNGIQLSLDREDHAFQSRDQAILDSLIDTQVAGRWARIWHTNRATGNLADGVMDESGADMPKVKLIRVEQADELIMAEVVVHRPAYGWTGFNPYRETRFYRETSEGWLRTVPDLDFWGAPQVVEAEFLHFELYARDVPLVEAKIADWNELYRSLHTMLGLEISSNKTQLVFEVVPEPITGRGGYGDRYKLISPVLIQTPDYLSSADYLAQAVVSRLTYHVTNADLLESSNGQRYEDTIIGRWRMARRGLRSWLRSELLEPDWPWDQQAQAIFQASLKERQPLRLSALSSDDFGISFGRQELLWRTAATSSIFAYVTDIYGEEQLPKLVRGLKEHRSWDALIPTLFSMSVEEFETDWNLWLDNRRRS